ncbi:hypothetical protein C9974_07615 [Marinobacter sp. B9-2]|nr:hypothetical protein C9974_07615 [Marinobacter sp. B9-2]
MSSEAKKFLIASSIMTGSRLAERLLGLISTLIIARVLVPSDFGIIAIAMLFVMLIDILSQSGAQQYIVHKTEVSDEDLNTAWTLNLLLKSALVLVIFLAAPLVANFYEDSRLTDVLMAMSLCAPIMALSSPDLLIKIRDQRYEYVAKIMVITKFVGITISISLALIYQNYWALIAGQVGSSISRCALSYIFLPRFPKLTLKRIHEQWSFSKWMMLKEVLGYLRSQSDMLLVGKFYSLSSMGGYHISKYISSMPTTELLQPALAPLLATFSKKKNNKTELLRQANVVMIVLTILVVPIAIYLHVFSEQIVGLLLGSQWIDYHLIFGMMALLAISNEVVRVPSTILTAKGEVKFLFYYDVISSLTVVAVLFMLKDSLLTIFVLGKVVAEFIMAFIFSLIVARNLGAKRQFLSQINIMIVYTIFIFTIAKICQFIVQDMSLEVVQLIISGVLFISLSLLLLFIMYHAGMKKRDDVIFVVFTSSKVWRSILEKLKKV